jgi:plasmid maintenance system killer protein
MPKRRSQRGRSSTAAAKRRKKVTPKRTKARKAPRAQRVDKKRSAASKKAWRKRKLKEKLRKKILEHARDWRDLEMPPRDELYDYMVYLSTIFETEINDMYRMYFGYPVGSEAPLAAE